MRRWRRRTSCSARPSRRRSTARRSTRPSTTAPARRPTGITPGASRASRKASATTAPTTPRRPRRRSTSGRRRATRSTAPIKIQFNAGAGHEDVVQIIIDNLDGDRHRGRGRAVPDARRTSPQLADGACQICRSGWFADYPTYDNFMYDLFHSDAIGGNNHGAYSNPEFDALVDEAKADGRPDEQRPSCSSEAEEILLNDDIGVDPDQLVQGRLRLQRRQGRATSRRPTSGSSCGSRSTVNELSQSVHRLTCGRGRSAPSTHRPRELRRSMTSYIIRRLLLIIPTVFVALSFLFFLFFLLPGDPAELHRRRRRPHRRPGRRRAHRGALRARRPDPRAVRQLLEAHAPVGPRRVVPEPPQRQRDPRRAGGQQPPPRHLGDPHRDRRRHLRRPALRDPPVLVRATSSRRSSRRRRRRSPCSCSASSSSTCFAVYPNKHDWPEWARLRTSGHRARHVDALLHPDRRAVALPGPAGHHPRLRVDRARRPHDARARCSRSCGADYMRTARAKGLQRAHGHRCATACATP